MDRNETTEEHHVANVVIRSVQTFLTVNWMDCQSMEA